MPTALQSFLRLLQKRRSWASLDEQSLAGRFSTCAALPLFKMNVWTTTDILQRLEDKALWIQVRL